MTERMESRVRVKRTFHTSSKASHERRRSADRAADSAQVATRPLSATNRSTQSRNSKTAVRAERLSELTTIVPVPILMVDLHGFLQFSNEAWVAATGGGDGLGRSAMWSEACHPDDRARVVAAFRAAVAKGEKLDIDIRLQAADGTYRWWSLAAVPYYGPNGRVTSYVGACSDASARHQAREQPARRLTARLVAAQESERSRIARELHDDLGQRLALLAAGVTATARKCGAAFRDVHKQLGEITTAVHSLSYRLHPGKLKLIGLVKTLESLCRDMSSEYRLHVAFSAHGILSDVTGDEALCLFRVAQEALQNAVKHSAAQTIRIHIARDGHHVRLQVTDDGRGFQSPAAQSEGLGLLTMRERVELMRGTLRIQTAPDRGTTIEAVIPTSGPLAPR
jgi:PAS domain S-box-containing protein